jgi:hypothetical protein
MKCCNILKEKHMVQIVVLGISCFVVYAADQREEVYATLGEVLLNKDLTQPMRIIATQLLTLIQCAGACLKEPECIAFSLTQDNLGNMACKLASTVILYSSNGSKVYMPLKNLISMYCCAVSSSVCS